MTTPTTATYDSKPWLKNYPAEVAPDLGEIPYANIGVMCARVAARYKDKKAYTLTLPNGMEGSLTFQDVDNYSNYFAAYLRRELKLPVGTRVAVQLPNCLSYPIAAFGILKAGCVLVNTNPLYTPDEIVHQFNDSGAQVLVACDVVGDKFTQVITKTPVKNILMVSVADFMPWHLKTMVKLKLKLDNKVPKIEVQVTDFMKALEMGMGKNSVRECWMFQSNISINGAIRCGEWVGPQDLACLQYTGGTTGVSKGAELTHGNFLANVQQLTQFVSPKLAHGQDTIISALPLYHVFAFTVNFLLAWSYGSHNILIPNPRPISALRPAFEKHPVTWITGVNTLFNALCDESWFQAKEAHAHLKLGVAGGAALQGAVADKWKTITGKPLIEGYGLTESSPVALFNPLGDECKLEGIGIPLPGIRVRLVGDNMEPIAVGEAGELAIQGPQVMKGYWGRPDETAKVLKNGWLLTGDMGVMSADGYFKIVDRKKEMILVSGFNVYPNEVEDTLAKHPSVMECGVIGVPDDQSGEAVRAYVVLKGEASKEDLIRHCREHLVGYKIPKQIHFRAELPKSPIGKILRKELRKEAQAEKR